MISILHFPKYFDLYQNISNYALVAYVPGPKVIPVTVKEIFTIYSMFSRKDKARSREA